MNEPTHTILLEAATAQLTPVQSELAEHGIRAEIIKPPGAKLNA